MLSALLAVLKFAAGPTIDRILTSLEKSGDSRSEVLKALIENDTQRTNARRDVLLQGAWVLWLIFAIPSAGWYAAGMADSVFQFSWNVAALPPQLLETHQTIIQAIFLSGAGLLVLSKMR